VDRYKVGIIGAGPAGIACAIQLRRYGIDFLLFEKNEPGGLLKNAFLVENYLGFPEGINGRRFVELILHQIKNQKINIINEEVLSVSYKNNEFHIITNKDAHRVKILVVASGTKPKILEIPGAPDCQSRIFYEISPLRKTKNKKIAIIGSGDAAFDYALSLSKNNKVLIMNRTRSVKSLPVLIQKALQNRNICYKTNIEVTGVELNNDDLTLYCSKDRVITVDYLIVAIGRVPNLNFFEKSIKQKIKMLEKRRKLYIIGDAKNGIFRQTAIAVSDGIRTAMEIYLSNGF